MLVFYAKYQILADEIIGCNPLFITLGKVLMKG